jgi:predicted dehydrogenase
MVGCGARSQMYQDAIEEKYAAVAELVAVCDRNVGRVQISRARSLNRGKSAPQGFAASDFELMIRETRPDTVLVLTVDATHHDFIIRALDLGCDVITEKPMTISAEACQTIAEAKKRSGKNCRVTFNYRYSPPRTQVKELLMSGVIGEVLSVDFHWLLDTVHGADYFRRWHSDKTRSGGLLVHKATHHFDLINWWLSAVPLSVFATGTREFYRPETARRLGLQGHHERCATCPEADLCTFFLNLAEKPTLRQLYLEQESHDGYIRDQCVWRPDISIEDTMTVQVRYDTGAALSYSLSAFNACEGYTIAFNGTKGRLEHGMLEQTYVSGTDVVQGGARDDGVFTRVIPMRGGAEEISVWAPGGSHGGGDIVLLEDLFSPVSTEDKYLRVADERAGAYSVLVGVAANESIATGKVVSIADLAGDILTPTYPPMPHRNDPLPMPPRVI